MSYPKTNVPLFPLQPRAIMLLRPLLHTPSYLVGSLYISRAFLPGSCYWQSLSNSTASFTHLSAVIVINNPYRDVAYPDDSS